MDLKLNGTHQFLAYAVDVQLHHSLTSPADGGQWPYALSSDALPTEEQRPTPIL
jgi:hypothetical protein